MSGASYSPSGSGGAQSAAHGNPVSPAYNPLLSPAYNPLSAASPVYGAGGIHRSPGNLLFLHYIYTELIYNF